MTTDRPTSATVAVSGASGLIGTALTTALRTAGYSVRRLIRGDAGPGDIGWNPATGAIDADGLDGIDAIVNLSGAGIGDHRWTDGYKHTLVASRVESTDLLARTIARLGRPPRVFLSASAVGFYGNRGDEELDESAPPGDGFLADLCRRWEDATAPAADAGVATTLLRTGVVLTTRGGALAKQLPLFKLGLGAKFGSGRQYLAWISLDDHIAACLHLLAAELPGPVNLTAPLPVRNAEFTSALADAVHRWHLPIGIPMALPSLVLGAERATHLLGYSQRAIPVALQRSGFAFSHPVLPTALAHVLGAGGDQGR